MEYGRREQLWVWLHQVTGAHVVVFEQLISAYPDIEVLFALAKQRKTSAFARWGTPFSQKICDMAKEETVQAAMQWVYTHHVDIVPLFSSAYPALLKEIRHPPPLLYVKGHLPANPTLPIAVVGMRRHTAYGEAVALHLGEELAKHGVTVVSGMASGIDGFAAAGALRVEQAACPTVAVLGSGIDVVYPSSNARLYDEIAARGAVVSEFTPGTRPLRENFPIRNRVISGLSRGVVIVEAATRSGTTITANHALDQNRDVFAVPGRITDMSSVGPNGMIQRGEAKPVFCAADILCEYGIYETKANAANPPDTSMLSPIEKCIVEQLLTGEKSADELCECLQISVAEVNINLTSLEFSGIIKQLPGRTFGL